MGEECGTRQGPGSRSLKKVRDLDQGGWWEIESHSQRKVCFGWRTLELTGETWGQRTGDSMA